MAFPPIRPLCWPAAGLRAIARSRKRAMQQPARRCDRAPGTCPPSLPRRCWIVRVEPGVQPVAVLQGRCRIAPAGSCSLPWLLSATSGNPPDFMASHHWQIRAVEKHSAGTMRTLRAGCYLLSFAQPRTQRVITTSLLNLSGSLSSIDRAKAAALGYWLGFAFQSSQHW